VRYNLAGHPSVCSYEKKKISSFLRKTTKGSYCCSLFSHSGEKDADGVRYFSSNSSLRASRSGFIRLRGRCWSRMLSIQSSATSASVEDSWTLSRALSSSSAIFPELPGSMQVVLVLDLSRILPNVKHHEIRENLGSNLPHYHLGNFEGNGVSNFIIISHYDCLGYLKSFHPAILYSI
jgi:hypothetical protein